MRRTARPSPSSPYSDTTPSPPLPALIHDHTLAT